MVPILNQTKPDHTFRAYFCNIRSNIILSYIYLDLPSVLSPSGFPTKVMYARHIISMRATCPAHLILLHFITLINFVSHTFMQHLITQSSPASRHFLFLRDNNSPQ